MMLTLAEAIREGRLSDFIAQAEAADIGPVEEADLEAALRRVITSPQGSRPASRSPRDDGSPER